MRQAAACKCGQVLFDVVERKAGDTLTCPWCNSEYRYLGDGKVEAMDAKPASGDKVKKPESKELEKEKEKEKKKEPEKKDHAEAKPDTHDAKKPDEKPHAHADPLNPKGSRRIKTARKDDVPGGFPIMIGFIIGFNGAAFIALWIIRQTEWATFVPRTSTWPLIAALIVGHIVGFIAWSAFIYYRIERTKDGSDPNAPGT